MSSNRNVYEVDDQPPIVYPLLEKERNNSEKKPNDELFEGKAFIQPPDRYIYENFKFQF